MSSQTSPIAVLPRHRRPLGQRGSQRPAAPPRVPRRLLVAVAAVAVASALLGLSARATYGAATSADEPYYLLTAGSIAAGEGLDIGPAIQREAFRAYHAIDLDPQAVRQADGRLLSPHDPLLPLVSAPAYALGEAAGIGGWIAVKVWLALIAGAAAVAALWLAVTRLHAEPGPAAVVVTAAVVGVPLSAYGSQVYPELPAALLVTLAVGLVLPSPTSAPTWDPRAAAAVLAVVVALPWLSIKYAPVAAVLALIAVVRLGREHGWRAAAGAVGGLALAGMLYLGAHQAWYGGWTAYAAGDHFVESGELSVVGVAPDYLGRARRLVGLLVDSRFGIGTWSPVWLLLPAATGAALRARSAGTRVVLGIVLVGWLVATFVALTMHGWWVPGRQVVVVLPAAAALIAVLASHVRWVRIAAAVAGALGAINWAWLAMESSSGTRTLIVDFFATAAIPYRWLAAITPEGMPSAAGPVDAWLLLGWTIALVGSGLWGWRSATRAAAHDSGGSTCVRR